MEVVWDHPEVLLCLWLLVPVAAVLWFREQRRARARAAYLSDSMARRLLPQAPRGRALVRGALVLAALACLCVAAARPRWGVYFEQMTQRGRDLLVALDVSRSMLSEDVAPNRLQRARSDILDLLEKVGTDRVGLVAFAGKAVVVCPLTTDHGFFRLVLDQTGPDSVPVGGTAIGDAIRLSLDTLERTAERDQAILLITDGEDHDSYPEEAAAAARERGVKLFTVGLGSSDDGARVPVPQDGGLTYLKYEGREVWSKLDEGLLQDLALATGGAYVPAGTRAYDLGRLYEAHLEALRAGELRSDQRKRHRDRFQIFVAGGLALLLGEAALSAYRRRTAVPGAAAVVIALCSGGVLSASEGEDAAAKVRAGISALDAGNAEEAVQHFDAAAALLPENPIVAFDRGVALHAQEDHEAARSAYASASAAADPALAGRAHYNLGAVAAERARQVLGEHPEDAGPEAREEALARVEEALRHYRACLDVDPGNEDARHNLELLRLWGKYMTNVWAEKDRQREEQEKEQMDLLTLLEQTLEAQEDLRRELHPLVPEPDSPRRSEALGKLAQRQEELLAEMPRLDEKLEEQFAVQQPAQQPPPPGQDEERAQALAFLQQQVDAARAGMQAAREALESGALQDAEREQQAAVRTLDQLWRLLVPFDRLLSHAIRHQQEVVAATAPLAPADPAVVPDLVFPQEDESRIAELSELLVPKGEALVQQLESLSPPASGEEAPPDEDLPQLPPPDAEDDDAGTGAASGDPQEALLEGLRLAVEKAREHAPRIGELTRTAAEHLGNGDAAAALPPEEEALKLLRAIAESLPENEQQQDQQERSQGENPEDQGQDQGDPQEPQPPQDPAQEEQGGEQPSPEAQPLTRDQIEALLRKAEEAEREANERRQALERILVAPRKVDRDW